MSDFVEVILIDVVVIVIMVGLLLFSVVFSIFSVCGLLMGRVYDW